jgi:hypothetical protein
MRLRSQVRGLELVVQVASTHRRSRSSIEEAARRHRRSRSSINKMPDGGRGRRLGGAGEPARSVWGAASGGGRAGGAGVGCGGRLLQGTGARKDTGRKIR